MTDRFYSVFIAFCVGAAAFCAAWYVLRSFAAARGEGSPRGTELNGMPLLFRMLLPFSVIFRRWSRAEAFRRWRGIEEKRLAMAGFGEELSGGDMVAAKLLFSLLGLVFVALGVFAGQLLLCLIIGVLLALYPGLWLSATVKKRHLSITKALPNVLDLLTLSVESGRDLVSSLRDILARRRPDALGMELTRAFNEMQFGRKRSEALRAMADRVGLPALSATVGAIVQAEELGVSIARLLRIQSDMQRAKRFALAEKAANEASVKIILPVVLFILPAVFIILLGPLALQTIRMFQ